MIEFLYIYHHIHSRTHHLCLQWAYICRYSLRERQHSFQLSNIEFLQFKNSFINWCLFKFRWLHSASQSDVFFDCVHIVRIVRLTLHFILCSRFYVLLLHSICNSVRMTCLIKRLLILSYLSYEVPITIWLADFERRWRRLVSVTPVLLRSLANLAKDAACSDLPSAVDG